MITNSENIAAGGMATLTSSFDAPSDYAVLGLTRTAGSSNYTNIMWSTCYCDSKTKICTVSIRVKNEFTSAASMTVSYTALLSKRKYSKSLNGTL